MDSGNSSSMQSSSGGDDQEYDSRADQSLSISAFLDNPHHHPGAPPPPPPPAPHPSPPPPHPHPHPQHHHHQLHFDNPLLSTYFNTSNILPSSSASPPFLHGSDPTQPQHDHHLRSFAATSSIPRPPPPPPPSSTRNFNHIGPVAKNPKKRSRASRRAPTTVLTTDTSNFRAMVQEFTGIPAPLFSNNINTHRLNSFFGLSPSSAPNNNSSYSNLLRPFAQKPPLVLTTTPPPLISSMSCHTNSITQHHLPNSSNNCSTSTDNIYQNLNLQSLLQLPISSSTSHDHHNNVKTSGGGVDNLVEDQFGGLGGLQQNTAASAMFCRRREISTANGENGEDHDNINPLRLMTDHNDGGDNEPSGIENVTATRNEGTIESWLCSSSSDQRS